MYLVNKEIGGAIIFNITQFGTGLDRLPAELQDLAVFESQALPFGLDEAKGMSLELMDERKAFAIK